MRQVLFSQRRYLSFLITLALLAVSFAAKGDASKKQGSLAQEQQADALLKKIETLYEGFSTLRLTLETTTKSSAQKPAEKSKTTVVFRQPNQWRVENRVAGKAKPQNVFVADGSSAFTVSDNDFARTTGTEYQRKTGKEYNEAVAGAVELLFLLVSKEEAPEEQNGAGDSDSIETHIEYLAARQVDGEQLEGIRIQSVNKSWDFSTEDIYWFDVESHLWRRQQSILYGKHIGRTVGSSRIISHEVNTKVADDTFAAPPPFHNDVEEASARDLLERATRYYQSLHSIEAKFQQHDLRKSISEWDTKREGASHLWFRSPAFFRIDYDTESRGSIRRIMTDGKSAFIDEGDVIYRQSHYKTTDYIANLNLFLSDQGVIQGPALANIWQMMQGQNRLSAIPKREDSNLYLYYSLRSLLPLIQKTGKWEGIQFRLRDEHFYNSFEETILWFDTTNPQQPILRRVQSRSEQGRPFSSGEKLIFAEEVTFWQANPDLPEALFLPAPGANIKNHSER
jgi:outer membrane lipoprotein-sorting protein